MEEIRLQTGSGRQRRLLGTAESMTEARELAVGYLLDPRDTIEIVYFFDLRYKQCRGWMGRDEARRLAARRHRAGRAA